MKTKNTIALLALCFSVIPAPAYGEAENPGPASPAGAGVGDPGAETSGQGALAAPVTKPEDSPAAAPTTTGAGVTPLVPRVSDQSEYTEDGARLLLEKCQSITTVDSDNYEEVRLVLRALDFGIEKSPDINVRAIFTEQKGRIHGMLQTFTAKK